MPWCHYIWTKKAFMQIDYLICISISVSGIMTANINFGLILTPTTTVKRTPIWHRVGNTVGIFDANWYFQNISVYNICIQHVEMSNILLRSALISVWLYLLISKAAPSVLRFTVLMTNHNVITNVAYYKHQRFSAKSYNAGQYNNTHGIVGRKNPFGRL